jgi:hypothetical protein
MRIPGTTLSLLAIAAAAASCGGKVIVDGAMGQGGSTATATTGEGGASTASATTSSATTASVTTASVTASASTTGGGGPCDTGADCSTCPNLMTCYFCTRAAHPDEVALYDVWNKCNICDACYTTCASPMCKDGPPPVKDPCDFGKPGKKTCGGCAECSDKTTCKPELDACLADPACNAFLGHLEMCPKM